MYILSKLFVDKLPIYVLLFFLFSNSICYTVLKIKFAGLLFKPNMWLCATITIVFLNFVYSLIISNIFPEISGLLKCVSGSSRKI